MKAPKFLYISAFLLVFVLFLSGGILKAQSFTKIVTGPIVSDSMNSIGGCWMDVNGDTLLDLFVVNDGGDLNKLFLNNGDDTFTEVTGGALVNDSTNAWGATWGDIDNNGSLDVFVANWGSDSTAEFNNIYLGNGSGGFNKLSGSGLDLQLSKSAGCSWADYNLDGLLDLFVANGARAPNEKNFLFKNNGDGTFEQIVVGSLVNDEFKSSFGAWGDYDNDGDPDMYVVNEGTTQPNNFYRNNGDGTFTKTLVGGFVDDLGAGRGASWGDYDNDLDLDLYVTRWSGQDNGIYQNNGDGTFTTITTGDAVNDGGRSEGSAWYDLDNDRDLDLIVANWGNELNYVYLNDGAGNLTRLISDTLTTELFSSVGVAFGDYNRNGFPDLFIANTRKPLGAKNSLFDNNGNGNNFIDVQLVGVISNSSAIGARIYVKSGGIWQMREVSGQTGFGGQNSLWAHFGLGSSNNISQLIVNWPSGIVQILDSVSVNQLITITEQEPVGVESVLADQKVQIYPNPSSGTLHFNLPEAWQNGGQVHCQIRALSGQLMQESSFPAETELHIILPKHLGSGLYFVHLHNGSSTAAGSFLLK